MYLSLSMSLDRFVAVPGDDVVEAAPRAKRACDSEPADERGHNEARLDRRAF